MSKASASGSSPEAVHRVSKPIEPSEQVSSGFGVPERCSPGSPDFTTDEWSHAFGRNETATSHNTVPEGGDRSDRDGKQTNG